MKRKILWSLLAAFIIIMVGATIKFGPQLPIATGYVARMTCSCVYGAGREAEEVAEHNYFYSILGFVDYELDDVAKKVTADFFGFAKQVAHYRQGIGCVLINDKDDFNVQGFSNNKKQLNTVFWPKTSDGLFNIDKAQIQSIIGDFFDSGDTLMKRTTAIVVVYKDSIIAEQYLPPFDIHTPQLGWSMTKSLINAYVGLLVKDSLADLGSKALFPEWTDNRKDISLTNLLQMNSGLEWEEDYTKVSDATKMLYASDNVASLAVEKNLVHPIGNHWYYSSGTSNLLSQWIRNTLKDDGIYKTYLKERLFDVLQMENAWIEMDESGTLVGSSYSYATARDWAKFGQLYLHNGVYGDQQILPKGWTDFTRKEAAGSKGSYGAHFWLNKGGEYPDCPADMYYCDGYKGQFVYILPKNDLVMVRLGGEGKYFDGNRLISSILKHIENQ